MKGPILLYLVYILVIVISIPLILQKVGPNSLYGFRTTKTLSNDEMWYKANKFGGWTMAVAGLVSLVCLLLSEYLQRIPFTTFGSDRLGALSFVPIIVSAIVSIVYIIRL